MDKDTKISRDSAQEWSLLAARAQGGDAAAYRSLLSSLVPYIRRVLLRTLPRHRDGGDGGIDDIIQDILMSVHKALQTYDPQRPFLPWVNAIITFRRNDYLRAHYARKEITELSLDDPDTPDYLVTESGDGTFKDIEKAFASLPKQQQKAVELMKIKGYSAEEVSRRTGVSAGAVKVSVHRALQKLRERLI